MAEVLIIGTNTKIINYSAVDPENPKLGAGAHFGEASIPLLQLLIAQHTYEFASIKGGPVLAYKSAIVPLVSLTSNCRMESFCRR